MEVGQPALRVTQWRRRDGGSAMDNMAYKYYKNGTTTSYDGLTSNYYTEDMTNRLAYVNDAVSGSSPTTDIESGMGSTNYTYDAIGQLTADASEEIASIEWTVKNKVHKVIRTSTSTKEDLEFVYDAMGNRVGKIVKPHGSSVENGGSDDPSQWDFTYYTLDASGNVITVYTAAGTGKLKLGEQHIYGSERLGVHHRTTTLDNTGISSTDFAHRLGDVEYELKNHLGNVLVTVSDIPVPKDDVGSDNITDAFEPNVLTAQDYTPFGTIMGGNRGLNQGNARYGFNGKENDREIEGNGNSYDYGARMMNPRLGRWMSIDAMSGKYPFLTGYCFAGNNPLIYIDNEGNDIYYVNAEGNKQKITKSTIELIDNPTIRLALVDLVETKMGRKLFRRYENSSKTDVYLGTADLHYDLAKTALLTVTKDGTVSNPTSETHNQIFKAQMLNPKKNNWGTLIDEYYLSQVRDVIDETNPRFSEYLHARVSETIFHEVLHVFYATLDEVADHEKMGWMPSTNFQEKAYVRQGSLLDKYTRQLEKLYSKKIKQAIASNDLAKQDKYSSLLRVIKEYRKMVVSDKFFKFESNRRKENGNK